MNASKLLNILLEDLPVDADVTINEVGNLAVLDKDGNYAGWIDVKEATYNPAPVKPKKTRKERLADLIKDLRTCDGGETGHMEADNLLLDYIGNKDVTAAYNSIPDMWYA